MTARCIGFHDRRRCLNRCAKRMGDLCLCTRHGRIYALLIGQIRATTRAVLAVSRWETVEQGQAIINRINRGCTRQAS
jgi:hypothetical protein